MAQARTSKPGEGKQRRDARRFRSAAVAMLLVGLGTGPAPAASEPTVDRRHQGIENAEQAGIEIDPAVEAMMTRAPVGSCPNDPTLEGCPKAVAFVYSPEFFGMPEQAISARTRSSRALSRRIGTRVATADGHCHLKVTTASPYKAAGMAQMDANNYCDPGAIEVAMYTVLKKLSTTGTWLNQDGRWHQKFGSGWLYGSARMACVNSNYKQWLAWADAYANYKGIWYGGTNTNQHGIYCGT